MDLKIAIVGVGLAGSNILRTILDSCYFDSAIKIHLFEPRDQLGVGKAFEEDSRVKRLNIPHQEISLDPDNPDDFAEWLAENRECPLNFEGLASRVDCGHYIQDRMGPYYHHPQVTWFQEEVTRLFYDPQDQVYQLASEDQDYGSYEVVFLCIGHPDYQDYYQLRPLDHYIQDPYPLELKLSSIPRDHRVGILGTGPTGIDIYRYLAQERTLQTPPVFLNNEVFLKLSGIPYQGPKLVFSMTWQWLQGQQALDPQGFIPLDKILDLIQADFDKNHLDAWSIYDRAKELAFEDQLALIEANDQEVAAVIQYFEEMVPFYPYLYQSLRNSDRQRYVSDYEPFLDLFRTFTPAQTNRWLIEGLAAGRAGLVDEIQAIDPVDQGFIVKGVDQEKVDTIVNATGFNFDLMDNLATHPLLKDLYEQGVIQPASQNEAILAKWPECQVMSQRYGVLDNLYIQGMWLTHTHYRNNDFRSILSVSQKVAERFMAKYRSSSL